MSVRVLTLGGVSATKTHFARPRPPWRDGPGYTMCGRSIADAPPPHRAGWARSACVITPAADLIANAKAAAHAGKIRGSQYRSGQTSDVPGGLCTGCWERLAIYGYVTWWKDPVAVLRADMAIVGGETQVVLAKELAAFAALAAAHPAEFRAFIEAEHAFEVLAG